MIKAFSYTDIRSLVHVPNIDQNVLKDVILNCSVKGTRWKCVIHFLLELNDRLPEHRKFYISLDTQILACKKDKNSLLYCPDKAKVLQYLAKERNT
jgi:hypothetical protein